MADARDDTVELKLGGSLFGGWTDISIQMDLDAGAASFSLGVTKKDPSRDEDWSIEADSECEVTIGGETVISGYVDKLESDLDGGSHSITVTGRSKSADLIDCSAVNSPGSWRGKKLEDIATELAKPFGIKVKAETDTGGVIKLFAIQQGETAWEAIGRLSQHRGVLPIPNVDGSVRIVSAKPTGGTVSITQGKEPLSISGSHDVTERFSQYIVKGQSAGDDEVNGKEAAQPKAEAKDPAVKRYRPLVIVAEEQADLKSLKKRAEWEATVRAAKAQSADIVMTGWRRADGKLWELMNGVNLDAPAAWISDSMMVAGIEFALGEQGRIAKLHLVRPESYSQLPVPEEAEASKIKGKGKSKDKDKAKAKTKKGGG